MRCCLTASLSLLSPVCETISTVRLPSRWRVCGTCMAHGQSAVLIISLVLSFLSSVDILATSPSSGLVEAVPDTVSLHALKKNDPDFVSLPDFFTRFFGPEGRRSRARAVRRFVHSLAAYCVVCFLLQIKDRYGTPVGWPAGRLVACGRAVAHSVRISADGGYIWAARGRLERGLVDKTNNAVLCCFICLTCVLALACFSTARCSWLAATGGPPGLPWVGHGRDRRSW
jgi:hypothetical protein